nr:hypothetical protein CTI12_AA556770 [Ipomoea batatas]
MSKSWPLLSLAASASAATSLAADAALGAGWRMLKSTQAMAGMMGSKSASPRLSPSAAISAICWAAKAGSDTLRVEKIAPARAVPVRADETTDLYVLQAESPLGRFFMERSEMMGFGLTGLMDALAVVKLLALSMAVVAMVAAIFAQEMGGKLRECTEVNTPPCNGVLGNRKMEYRMR